VHYAADSRINEFTSAMSTEPFALSTIAHDSRAGEERHYDAIRATVMESARGRWFLEEYARRNRNADTQLVLAAMERIESLIRDEPHQPGYRIGNSDISQPPATVAATPAAVAQPQSGVAGAEPPGRDGLPADSEISALAERLQDLAWTMRERRLDAEICDQIESLASSLASCIRGPSPSQSMQGHQGLELNEAGINPFGAPSNSGEPAVAKEPEQQALACSADEETQLPEKASPAMPPLPSDIPQEDILSGAWEEAASKPRMETPLPTQQESSSPANMPEILDHSKIDIWGQSPDIVPAKSGQSDPMLVLEQELFATSAINPENEMRSAQAAPVVESQSAIATDNTPAKQPIVPKAMEQMLVAPVPAPNDSAAVHPAPILPTARPMPRATPDDPLAALRAMTDEERIALFT
jgi:hypothetical protein